MSDGFEVVCGELRKAAGYIRDDGDNLGTLGREVSELMVPAQAFGQIIPMDQIAAYYDQIRAKVGDALNTSGKHLDSVGNGLRDVARHYGEQDAENAKPFQRLWYAALPHQLRGRYSEARWTTVP